MQKFRNVIFVLVVCAALFCCLGNKIADRVLHVTDIPERSYLEGRAYQQLPELTGKTLLDGAFQDEAEQYVADLIPKRDSVLLANAAIQRSMISCANLVAGYRAYPTYFGSNYCCTADGKRVFEAPGSLSYYSKERFETAADEYSKLFANNAGVGWYVYMPDRGASSLGSPAHGLLNAAVDYDMLEKSFLSKLQGADVISARLDSADEFFENRYNTDHHWNAQGSVAGYSSIMKALNRRPINFDGFESVLEGKFNGSAARNGLCVSKPGDTVTDAAYEHGDIEAFASGRRIGLSEVCEAWGKDGGASFKKADRYANVYADYFHGDFPELRFHNNKGKGSLLILGDSFTNCMDRFFAESYRDVWVLDLRTYKGTVQRFLDEHQVDDALVLMGCTNIMSTEVCEGLN